jgi:hypothetical protein
MTNGKMHIRHGQELDTDTMSEKENYKDADLMREYANQLNGVVDDQGERNINEE